MKFKFFLLAILIPFLTLSEEKKNSLDLFSEKIGYDGEKLNLDGKISLSHPLGTLKSDRACLIKELEHQKNKIFDSILLEKKVRLELTNGGVLCGEKATYDLDNHKIEFLKVKNKIKFLDKLKNKQGKPLLFSIQSDKAYSTPLSSAKIDQIPFNFVDKVKINIDNKIAIYGNRATCNNDRISLYPKNERSYCKVTRCNQSSSKKSSSKNVALNQKENSSKDCAQSTHRKKAFNLKHAKTDQTELKIFSKFMEFNLTDSQLYLEKPHGRISGSLQFSSDKLYYNKDENKLTLDQNAILKDENSFLSCTFLDIFLNEKKLKKAITSSDARIVFNNESHSKITSFSPLSYDFEKKLASTDNLDSECSFRYEDDDLMVFSKKADIYFDEGKDLFKIQSAVLETQVVLISKSAKESSYSGISDKLYYDSEKNLIILESLPGQKVILVKNDGSLNLIADKIEIHHSKNIEDDKINAIGTVRFKLTLDEESKLIQSITRYKEKYDAKKPASRS